MKKNSLLLLMSPGMSLKRWKEIGYLDRELSIYGKLAGDFGEVYIFSYGLDEHSLVDSYPNVKVIADNFLSFLYSLFPGKLHSIINLLYEWFFIAKYKDLLKGITIIKTNQLSSAELAFRIKKKFNQITVIRMGFYHTHLLPTSTYKIQKEMMLFRKVDGILVTDPGAKEFLKQHGLVEQVFYMQNYIDTSIFIPKPIEKKFDVLFVGRLEPKEKNLDNFIEAILLNKHLKYVIIGQGKYSGVLEEFKKKYDLEMEIIPKVNNSELPYYYNSTNLFILPSFYEGNPKVLLEAMSCGCACIGTSVPGIESIIQHNINGYLCKTDAGSISQAINGLLNGEAKRAELGKKAREYILNNCSINQNLSREIKFYNELIEKKEKSIPAWQG